MNPGRINTLNAAVQSFDSGRFLDILESLVAVPTESHPPKHKLDLERYCEKLIRPLLEDMGHQVRIFKNTYPEHGPFLISERIESPTLPTLLLYGHGDVVRAMPELWREGLQPWQLLVEGDRVYGRGTVDNKGQHLIFLEALRAHLRVCGAHGFNIRVLIEMGEEAGSPGLENFLETHSNLCEADLFLALDGPRQSMDIPDLTLGTRGSFSVDLEVNLRPGNNHSGHWGGVLEDPAAILANVLSTLISRDGRILVDGWRPQNVPSNVKKAAKTVRGDMLKEHTEKTDRTWGEPGLSSQEKIYAWNSAVVLSMISGQPENPIGAVSGFARARIQLRYIVDTPTDTILPALRGHLDANGFSFVDLRPVVERDMFPPHRTSPDDPWVLILAESMRITSGYEPNIIPSIGASGPSAWFAQKLNLPVIWIPHSYGGCGQHGPDEHGLVELFRDGLKLMAGIFFDIGNLTKI